MRTGTRGGKRQRMRWHHHTAAQAAAQTGGSPGRVLQTPCAACGPTLRGQPALARTFGRSWCTTLRCMLTLTLP